MTDLDRNLRDALSKLEREEREKQLRLKQAALEWVEGQRPGGSRISLKVVGKKYGVSPWEIRMEVQRAKEEEE